MMRRRSRYNPSDVERARAGDRNLEGADLRGADLSDVVLSGCNLRGANLEGAKLRGALFDEADLTGANLRRADLTMARFFWAWLINATLEEALIQGTVFHSSTLSRANMRRVSVGEGIANFYGAKMVGTDLSGAVVSLSSFQGADLTDANLSLGEFIKTYFNHADLTRADFTKAVLRKAQFSDAKVIEAQFTNADCRDADFRGAKVKHSVFEGALLEGIAGLALPKKRVKAVRVPTTDAFRRWFGHSKIVNRNGSPKVLYHGTNKAGFTAFSAEKIDAHHPGFFLADDAKLAQTYAGSAQFDPFAVDSPIGIYRVFVKMERPFVYDAEGADWDRIPWDEDTVNTDHIGKYAKERGYDGVIIQNVVDIGSLASAAYVEEGKPSNVYIVFDPKNIKSAAYNEGTFDSTDADIRHNPRHARRSRNR